MLCRFFASNARSDIATLIHKRRGSIAKAIALFNPRTEKGRVRVYGCRSPGKPGTQLLTVLSMLGVQKLMASSKYQYSKRVRQWTMDWAKALLKAIPIRESKTAAPADTTSSIKHLAALVFKDKITPAEVEVLSQAAFDRLKLTFGGKPILPETVVEEGAEGDMEEEPEDDDEIADEELQQEEEEGEVMADEGAAAAAGSPDAAEMDLNDMFADGNDDNLMMDNDDDLPWLKLNQENEPVAAAAAAAAASSKRVRSSASPQRASASPPAAAARAPKVKPVKAKSKTSRLASTEAASSSSSAAAAAAGAPDPSEAELVQSLMERTSSERRNEKRREKAKQKREEARVAASAAAATAAAAKSPSPPVPKKKRTHSPAMAAAAASLSRAARSPSPPVAKVSSRSQAAPPIPKRVKRESLGTSQISPARPMLDVRSLSHLCTPESTPRLTPLTVSASSASTHATPSFASVFGAGSTPQSRDITPLSSRQNSPMPLYSGMQPVKRHLRMSSNPAGMVDLAALEVAAGATSGTGSGFSPKGVAAGSTMASANPQQQPQHAMALTATTPMAYHPSNMVYSQFNNPFMASGFAQQQQQQQPQMLFHSSMNFSPHVLSPVGAGQQQQPTSMFSPAHGHSKSVTLPTPSHSLMHSHSQSHGGAFTFGSTSLSPRGTSFNPNTFMQHQSSGTQVMSHLRGGMVSSAAPMFASGFPSAQAQQAHHALNQQLAAHLKDASSAHATMPMVTQAIAVDHAPVMATAAAPAAAAVASSTPSAADSAAPMLTDKQP